MVSTADAVSLRQDASRAIEFYTKAFGATESMRIAQPDGKSGTPTPDRRCDDHARRRVPDFDV